MTIREQTKHWNDRHSLNALPLPVSHRAGISPIEECPLRTCYQRDRDRIIHCKSFRRLKHKTQVFLALKGIIIAPDSPTPLEVAQIARTIARGLRLNEDLTEAVAMGHDLGHTPFVMPGTGAQ